jgi:hypothetical protein
MNEYEFLATLCRFELMGLAEKTLKELNSCEQSGAGVRIRPQTVLPVVTIFYGFAGKISG